MKVGDLINHKGVLHVVLGMELYEPMYMPKEWVFTLKNMQTLQTIEIPEKYIRR